MEERFIKPPQQMESSTPIRTQQSGMHSPLSAHPAQPNTKFNAADALLERITQLWEKTTKMAAQEVQHNKKPTMEFNTQTDISAGRKAAETATQIYPSTRHKASSATQSGLSLQSQSSAGLATAAKMAPMTNTTEGRALIDVITSQDLPSFF